MFEILIFKQEIVTILILIDGFLQSVMYVKLVMQLISHNPYFNRWFSAIRLDKVITYLKNSHNPYFNRWFSAINKIGNDTLVFNWSQSLF